MIERVARAICAANREAPDSDLNNYGAPAWQMYVADAAAAIEAMREPSNEMIDAAANLPDVFGMGDEYRAMIDAALQEAA